MSALGLLTLAEQAPEPQRLEYLALIRRSLNKLNAFIEDMHQFYRTGKMAINTSSSPGKRLSGKSWITTA